MQRPLFVAAGVAAVAALVACSALIGTRDLTLQSDDGGGAAGDGAIGIAADGAPIPPGADGGADGAIPPGQDGGDGAPPTCSGANLQTDVHHCGRCGHDCLGGGCDGGQCQPFTLVPNQAGANGIAVDDAGIYWTTFTAGQVLRANKDGTAVTVLGNEPGAKPLAVTTDATSVYWTLVNTEVDTPPGRVDKCAKSGCPGGATHLTPALREAYGIAVDDANVYWSEYDNGAIGRVNKNDGSGFGYLVTQQGFANSVALNGGTAYFGATDEVGAVAANASVVAKQTDTATATFRTIDPAPGTADFNPFGLAVDDTNVYWANNYEVKGAILFAPKGSTGQSPPSTLSGVETLPVQVALDDTNVYWVAAGPNSTPSGASATYVNGYLAMCPKTGCPTGATKLATDLHNPRWVAVDATAIYFTIHGNAVNIGGPTEGSVMKLAK